MKGMERLSMKLELEVSRQILGIVKIIKYQGNKIDSDLCSHEATH